MSLILDTSFLIAIYSERDEHHSTARRLLPKLQSKEYGQTYISDYIFDEFVTFLRARSYPESTLQAIGDRLKAEDSSHFLHINECIFSKSWELFKKYPLSFTDCTTIILTEEFGIHHVASFDAGFDRIPHLKRIC